jgi:hypothetical protein
MDCSAVLGINTEVYLLQPLLLSYFKKMLDHNRSQTLTLIVVVYSYSKRCLVFGRFFRMKG